MRMADTRKCRPASLERLNAHFTGPALAGVMGAMGDLIAGAPEMITCAVVDGKGVTA